jgi:ABC-type protease/lipase transport system fused ATPase/permease subunit
MVFYKIMFWLTTFFVIYIWQIILFILALVNRAKTTKACNEANHHQNYDTAKQNNANVTVEGYTATLLGLNMGNTYGLANCDQAVEAGIIGIAVLLFVGGLFMVCSFDGYRCNRSQLFLLLL